MPVIKTSKDEIIKTAFQIFKKQGYHATSMDKVALACGLLKGSIYHYFSGKKDLMLQVLTYYRETFRENVLMIAYDVNIPYKERIRRIFEVIELNYLDEDGCIMGNIGLETTHTVNGFNDIIKGFFEDWIKAFTVIYKYKYDYDLAEKIAKERVQEVEGAVMLCKIFNTTSYINHTVNKIMQEL